MKLRCTAGVIALLGLGVAQANNTPQSLPFSQDWSNAGLITTDDDWSGVAGIEGFRGDNITGTTGVDPQTLLAADATPTIDVNANQTNPDTFVTGGATEFAITNAVVALTGSGTADAPYLQINLNTSGKTGITVSYSLRDIDGSTDNSVQPVALQFRVGNAGNFSNVPAAFVADASGGPSLATLVTPVSATLPAAVDNQPLIQLRIMTSNAIGNDEQIGVDDLSVVAATPVSLQSYRVD
ncbi:MAG: hypothetical protein ABI411_08050 [Tahibacter sp.]